VALAKLYERKNALVADDMLNDRVLQSLKSRMFRCYAFRGDRGTEYWGQREHHGYQLYLAVENIDHSRTRAKFLIEVPSQVFLILWSVERSSPV
jgi:hypothetical protein